jgi:hypothetical protein
MQTTPRSYQQLQPEDRVTMATTTLTAGQSTAISAHAVIRGAIPTSMTWTGASGCRLAACEASSTLIRRHSLGPIKQVTAAEVCHQV